MNACDACDAAKDGKCYTAAGRQPVVTHHVADDVQVMVIDIPDAGTITPQHSHAYEHMTVVAAGSVVVTEKTSRIYRAPEAVIIPAGVKHLFTTLTDNVRLMCIHNTSRVGCVEVLDEHEIVGEPMQCRSD